MYELLKKDGMAKRGRFHTVHGTIETPVFMNVGTAAAIKGAVSTDDLRQIKTQVELSNTIGISRFSRTQADFKCFHLHHCARLKKKEFIFTLI